MNIKLIISLSFFCIFLMAFSVEAADSAMITSFNHPTGNLNAGTKIYPTVTFVNTGDQSKSYGLGLSYRLVGTTTWIDEIPKSSVPLSPGASTTVSFNEITLPSVAGTYEMWVNVYSGYSGAVGLLEPVLTGKLDNPAFTIVQISISPSELFVSTADTGITFTARDQNNNLMSVLWSSSNTAVGTIGTTGIFTPISIGTTTITATSGSANKTAWVGVTPPSHDSVIITNFIHPTGNVVAGSTIYPTVTIQNTGTWGKFYIVRITYRLAGVGLTGWLEGGSTTTAMLPSGEITTTLCNAITLPSETGVYEMRAEIVSEYNPIYYGYPLSQILTEKIDNLAFTIVPPVENPLPLYADFSISPSDNVELGRKATFDASLSTGNIISYDWYFGDSLFIGQSGGSTATHLYMSGGSYPVTLIVKDNEGNSKSITKTITINSKYENSFLNIEVVDLVNLGTYYSGKVSFKKMVPLNIHIKKYSNNQGIPSINVGNAVTKNPISDCLIPTKNDILDKLTWEVEKRIASELGYNIAPIGWIKNLYKISVYVDCIQDYRFFKADETDINGNLVLHVPYESMDSIYFLPIGGTIQTEDDYIREIQKRFLDLEDFNSKQYLEPTEQLIYVNKTEIGLSTKTPIPEQFAYIKRINPSAIPNDITFYYEPPIQQPNEFTFTPKLEIIVKKERKLFVDDIPIKGIPISVDGIGIGSTDSNGILRVREDIFRCRGISFTGPHLLEVGDGIVYGKENIQFEFNSDGTTTLDVFLNKISLPLFPSLVTVFAKSPLGNYPDLVNYPQTNSIKNFINNAGGFAEYPDPDNLLLKTQGINATISESDWIVILTSFDDMNHQFGFYYLSPENILNILTQEHGSEVVYDSIDVLESGATWQILKYNTKDITTGEKLHSIYYIVTEDKTDTVETAVTEFLNNENIRPYFSPPIMSATPCGGSGTSVQSSTGKGTVYLDTNSGTVQDMISVNPVSLPEPPVGANLEYGLIRFTITDVTDIATLTLTFPNNLPLGTTYWKYGKTNLNPTPHWYTIPAIISGNQIMITITDGGLGDDDLNVNGIILDDGGPSIPQNPEAIPEFPTIALPILSVIGILFVLRRGRRD